MKEITRISLAALPYNIEVDAKKQLEKYLSAINHSLDADVDTMKEIESRVAELLADRGVSGEKVISSDDVAAITTTLGEPKDFVDDASPNLATSNKKRMMRDSANEMIGGVASGMAAYFGMDSVWVRLAWILLTIVTSGFMILVYLVLWAVMPAARSAADRLRMKGEAVTPSALQIESEVMSKKEISGTSTRLVARIIAGILAAGIGIAVAVAIVLVGWHAWVERAREMTEWLWLYGGLIVFAGVLFVLFCWLSSYMLIAGKATKRLFIGLGAIAVFGLTTFIIGTVLLGLGLDAENTRIQEKYSMNLVHRSLDASPVKRAKRLELRSELPITINYNVDPTQTEVTVWYNKAITKNDPQVTVQTSVDGVLTVNVAMADNHCLPDVSSCRVQTTVTIVGPELESVFAQGSNLVRYIVDTQDKLTVLTRADGRVELQAIGVINQLTATLQNESRLDTTQAGVKNINLTIEDALSNVDIATVETLSVTVPTACAANHGGGTIAVKRAGTIIINGKAYDAAVDYPCTTIQADNF